MPSFQDEPQMTYSCLADDNSLCRVHVLAVYEGNRHTIPPTAGDMEVMVEGQRSADERRGVVLVLVSFEPVNWNVHLVGQSMIERVILVRYIVFFLFRVVSSVNDVMSMMAFTKS